MSYSLGQALRDRSYDHLYARRARRKGRAPGCRGQVCRPSRRQPDGLRLPEARKAEHNARIAAIRDDLQAPYRGETVSLEEGGRLLARLLARWWAGRQARRAVAAWQPQKFGSASAVCATWSASGYSGSAPSPTRSLPDDGLTTSGPPGARFRIFPARPGAARSWRRRRDADGERGYGCA